HSTQQPPKPPLFLFAAGNLILTGADDFDPMMLKQRTLVPFYPMVCRLRCLVGLTSTSSLRRLNEEGDVARQDGGHK
ncbi:hypothetical protein LINPERHAP2_LOCUS4050, partial [Linum perenne]